MKKMVIILLSFYCSVSYAQNTPCSRGKGGIDHCNGSSFICKDGSESASTKDCAIYFTETIVYHPGVPTTLVKRNPSMVRKFKKVNVCPSTHRKGGKCPGYVVDHIKALACGGLDDPSNMQFQTIADGKAKDAIELNCAN